jgi:hypothetical protein
MLHIIPWNTFIQTEFGERFICVPVSIRIDLLDMGNKIIAKNGRNCYFTGISP